ncbi:hypothetical protein MATL_G00040200 [Megalops atlanticus]|uniref:Protein ripply3 n=1 Tax=Megalops atlanticus TaxID=7932 RepID=A0A9D3TI52_MEGAT|nr:hypothetical protein MATL_G00040200 [Megalops atlanticus]
MLPLNVDMQSAAHTVKAHGMRSHQSYRATVPPVDLEQTKSYPVIWRPWVLTDREVGMRQEKSESGYVVSQPKGALGFQHPVRLCMPKSRTQEYLSYLGKKVLASFPVQATLHFYNDDSSSEEDDEDDEEQELEEIHPHRLNRNTHSVPGAGPGR